MKNSIYGKIMRINKSKKSSAIGRPLWRDNTHEPYYESYKVLNWRDVNRSPNKMPSFNPDQLPEESSLNHVGRLHPTRYQLWMREAVKTVLTVRQRQAWNLYMRRGLSRGETASIMRLKRSSIQMHISRAKAKVVAYLRDKELSLTICKSRVIYRYDETDLRR